MKLTEAMAVLFDELNVSKTDAVKACAVVLTSVATDSGQDMVIESSDGAVIHVDISGFKPVKGREQ